MIQDTRVSSIQVDASVERYGCGTNSVVNDFL
jgi:hypothetical protein